MKYRFLLFFLLITLLSGEIKAQCTGCQFTVTNLNGASINVTQDGQVFCLAGTGTFTGTITFNSHSGVTICVGPTVSMGVGTVINNDNAGAQCKFINYGNWTRDFNGGVMNQNMAFDNYGTVTTPAFNFTGKNTLHNYGIMNITGAGDINVNADNVFTTHPGSITNIAGNLYVPSLGRIDVGGVINVAGNLRVNAGGKIVGIPPTCSGITVQGSFWNDGVVGEANPYGVAVNKLPTDGSGTENIVVNNSSNFTLTNPVNTQICAGGNATFSTTVTGANNPTYQWQVNTGNGLFVSISDGPLYSGVVTNTLKINGAPLSMNGYQYRVLVTSCPYPKFSNAATLNVSGVPFLSNDVSTVNLCYQGTVLLDTKVLDSQLDSKTAWYLLPDLTNSLTNKATYNATKEGTYVVKLVNIEQCITVDTFKVKLFPYTLFDLGKNQDTVCSNVLEPIKVNGTWTDIVWNAPVTIPVKTTSWDPIVSGNYQVTVTDANTCKQTDAVAVTFNTAPTLQLGNDTSLICFGNPKAIVVPNPSSYNTIVWTAPAGVTIPNGTTSYIPKQTGTFTVTVGNTFKCYASDAVGVTYDTNPPIDLGPGSDTVCFNVLSPIIVPGGPYKSVTWTTDNGVSIPGTTTMRHDPTKSGTYKVTAIDLLGCTSSDQVTVQYDNTLATFDLGPPTMVACFNSPKDIEVNGSFTKIVWQAPSPKTIPQNTVKHFPDLSGRYTVTVTNSFKCSASDFVDVTYVPDIPFNLDPVKTVCWSDDYLIVANKAVGGYEYTSIKWTAPVTIPDQTLSWKPTVGGKYRVDVQSKGCPKSDSVTIDFIPKINIGLNGKDTLSCGYQGNYFIKAPGGYPKYEWFTPKPTGILVRDSIFYPRASGMHIVKVYSRNTGCFTSDSVNVKYDKDSVDIGLPNQTVCGNDPSFVITVAPDVFTSIVWTNNAGVTIPNGTKTYRPIKSGTYKVRATKLNGCFSIDSTMINYVDTLKVNLGGDSATSCEFKKTVLTPLSVTGNFNYIWTNNAGVTIPNGTSSYTPIKPGKYKVVVSDKNSPKCAGEDSIYVSIPDTISLNFNGDSGVSCFNAGYRLCGGAGYSKYDWKPSSVVPANTKECYSPTQDGKYSLTITDKYGCIKSDSIYVKYYGKLNLGLNNMDTAACYPYQDYLIQLPVGMAKYEWSPSISNSASGKPVYNGQESQKYIVKVTNKDGCFDTDSLTVHFVPEIKFNSIPGGDTTACGYAQYTIHAGPGFLKYEWVNNVAGLQDSLFIPKFSGKYWVTVTTPRGGCKKTSAITNVNFVPDRIIDLGGPVTSCSLADTLTLDAGPGFEKYMWEGNPAYNQRTFHPQFPENIVNTKIDTFTVDATYQKVCHAYASRQVTFIRQDMLTIGMDTIVCPGYPVTMSPGTGFDYYAWHYSLTPDIIISENPVLTVTDTGRYTVDVTSICGLQSPSRAVSNYTAPLLELGNDTTICLGKTIDLVNKSDLNNAYTYVWKEKGTNTNSGSKINILRGVSENGTYYVTAIDEHKCYVTDSINVVTKEDGYCFVLPNLITPNNDLLNDNFEIGGIRLNHWNLQIYNRWGDRVYESKGYNNDWNASGVTDGLYFYHLEDPSKDRQYKGWIQVVDKK